MKVYSGKRAFHPHSTTRGEPFVVVEKVVDDEPSDSRPLNHVPYHSPDGFEWSYAGSGPARPRAGHPGRLLRGAAGVRAGGAAIDVDAAFEGSRSPPVVQGANDGYWGKTHA